MFEIEKIKRYIERTKIVDNKDAYVIRMREAKALRSMEDHGVALFLAFEYGKAKGYRAAKAEGKRVTA